MKIKFKKKKDVDVIPTSEPYYDLMDGGYLEPENFVADDEQVKQIKEAIELVKNYMHGLKEKGLIEIM